METVQFTDVEDIFSDIWRESCEGYLHEIAWDCLEEAGLTGFSSDREYAEVFIYAYVIQRLCEEFSFAAFDETFDDSYIERVTEEPLTDAAVGWLYRDFLEKAHYSNIEECFSDNANDMFPFLVAELKGKVAEAIFMQLGDDVAGRLFFLAIRGKLIEATGDEENEEDIGFQSKEELLDYCRKTPWSYIDLCGDLSYPNAVKTMTWIASHALAFEE